MNIKFLLSLLSFTAISYSSEPAAASSIEISDELVAAYNAVKSIQKIAKICGKELKVREGEQSFLFFNSGIMLFEDRRPLALSTPFGGFSFYEKSNMNSDDDYKLDQIFREHMAKRGFILKFIRNGGEDSRGSIASSIIYEVSGVGKVTKEKLIEYRGKNVKVIGRLKDGMHIASFYEVSNIGDESFPKARYGQCRSFDTSLQWKELERRDILKKAAWRRLTMTGSLGIEPLIRPSLKTTKK